MSCNVIIIDDHPLFSRGLSQLIETQKDYKVIGMAKDRNEALSLLDSEYADPRVRAFAVECLETLSDDEIMLYMLQLVQALKYEMYDDSQLLVLHYALLTSEKLNKAYEDIKNGKINNGNDDDE